jgi:high affinity Mn2+ porin
MNWSFMSGGAWDYAADTRGYTWGIGSEWRKKNWRAALAFTLEPGVANSLEMDMHIDKAFASQAEITHFHQINGHAGQLQGTVFLNNAHMGNYREALLKNPFGPDITTAEDYKNHKWGWIINGAQQFNTNLGVYARISWNDGLNETWAFTEIDRSVNVGLQWSHSKTNNDKVLGGGLVINGLSKDHRNYLAAGGYGFIIGDGRLNYSQEMISEVYYRLNFFNDHLQVSPDYQFVLHPAYNKDRGPVHIFSLRTHIEL